MIRHLASLYEGLSAELGNRPALVHGTGITTWTEYEHRAATIASALQAHEIGRGSKVGLLLYNEPAFLETLFATLKIRAVPVNLNHRYGPQELRYVLEDSEADALFYDSTLTDRVRTALAGYDTKLLVAVTDGDQDPLPGAVTMEQLLHDHRPAEPIERSSEDRILFYTGGTTGAPKGVIHEVGSWTTAFVGAALGNLREDPATPLEAVPSLAADLEPGRRVVSVPCAPLMHGTGLAFGALIPHTIGATVVTLTGRSFDADELLTAIDRHAVTDLALVGDAFCRPILAAITRHGAKTARSMSTVRRIFSSGAMWTADVKAGLLDAMPDVALHDMMNATEGGMATQVSTRASGVAATGRFIANDTTKVFMPDGRELAPGSDEVGFIAVSGNIPLGYHRDAAKTAATFRRINGVRYAIPGDMATIAPDGSIVLLGRGNQVVNTGGEKVYPQEVEEAVKRLIGVVDCAVVGLPDDRLGQVVTAVVSTELESPISAADVKRTVKAQLAGYKTPRHVVFVDALTRGPTGKLDYPAATCRARDALGLAE